MRFIKFLIITYLLTIISCSPSLGASWYAKSGGSGGVSMYVTSIKVLDRDVSVNDPDYRATEGDAILNFARAKRFSITVPYSVKVIDADSFKIEVYEDSKKQRPLSFGLEIEGDSVPLVQGESVSVTLRVKDNSGRYEIEEKFISVTREMPEAVELKLLNLKVHDIDVENIESEKLVCNIPYSRGESVTAGDIRATFKVGEEEKWLPVILQEAQIQLNVGEEVEIAFSVEERQNVYKSFSSKVLCKRLEKADGEDEPLILEYLSVLGIDARSGLVKVADDVSQIVASDVVAMFKSIGRIDVTLQTEIVRFDSAGTAELVISVEGKAGEYSNWSRAVHAVKETQGNSQDPEMPPEEEPEEPSEPEPPALDNPVDENGQKKFVVKINVKKEEIDPFDYYKEDTFFPASSFNGWILNMTGMASDNVASYAFKEGEWSGVPLSCTGDDIGVGQLNVTKNLKYYKYNTQEERWRERGGYSSSIGEEEKKRRERFIFFRFTGSASMGIQLDNSMFCVDTHTKFLFYYSDPSVISTLGVPSGWKDYDEADEGSHKYFDKPFYLTDPVGYVKEDGECVIYGWCKQNIRSNNYRASVNSAFRKQASRASGGNGYSPYRDKKIKTTKERIVEENLLYTAEKPVITRQSGSLYLTVDSTDEAKLSVVVKKAPENEELSFQWYKNALNSIEGAIAIDGANVAEYTMPKEVMDVYCYCVVTNRNTKNNKEAKNMSQPIKVRIAKSSEDLKIDAETPIIKKHPQSSKYAFVEGNKTEISLSIEVNKPRDNGVLSYQWFESSSEEETENGTKIENATEKNYKMEFSDSGIKYYYCRVTNTNDKATGEKSVSVVSAVAKIEIEQLYKLTVSCLGKGSLEVIGSNGGSVVLNENNSTIQLEVRLGTKLFLLATPEKGWEIEKWEGDIETLGDVRNARIVLKNKAVIEKGVTLTFRNIPKRGLLGITSVLIENISLTGNMWLKNYDFTYFDWDIKVGLKDDGEERHESIWKNNKIRFMKQEAGASSYVMPTENAKDLEALLENSKATFSLNAYLHKKDSSELGGIYVHDFNICEHGKNVIEFDYHEDTDSWHIKDGEFDQIGTVTLDFDKTFTLKRGQEKNFEITYKVNNPSYYATGNVRIVYTLRWE